VKLDLEPERGGEPQETPESYSILKEVADSEVTPRRIRRLARGSIAALDDEKLSVTSRAANVVTMSEEATEGPNISSFTRVALWSAVSELEAISE
jgi:uncharacterized protein (UPF0147 family)